jgi:hypothetical protein
MMKTDTQKVGTKMFARISASFASALLLTIALMTQSCAEPEPINRVQPNGIQKTNLEGEWYLMDTVERSPYASGKAFAGLQGSLMRGMWEVEENFLTFYRTYEFVHGVEAQGLKSDTDTPMLDEEGNPITYDVSIEDGTTKTVTRYVYRSNPLARYPITSHFDIRQTYNSLTGEESNVTVEDSSERYWWEREYMRVDFGWDIGENHARLQWQSDIWTPIYEGEVGPEGIALRIQDDGRYMDFVTRHIVKAPQRYYGSYGWIPTCLFYAWYMGAYFECDTEEIHVRSSFMRVDENNNYKPLAYDDQMLGKFGFFRSHRQDWNDLYGSTFSEAIRQANRHNIWEQIIDDDGDGNPDYEAMTPKPVVFTLSQDFPRYLMPGALDLADQWNEPFLEIVRTLKNDPEFEGPMWVLCENSMAEVEAVKAADPNALVAETDPDLCGDLSSPRYLGDLRYSFLNSVNEPTQFGLGGYGPSATDPLTGQTIKANANMYTANLRMSARTATDMVEYESGVQSFKDITQAQHITTSIQAKALKGTQREPRSMTYEQAVNIAQDVITADVSEGLTTVGIEQVDHDMARARMSRLLDTDDYDFVWNTPDMAALVGLPIRDLDSVADDDGFLRSLVHPAHMNTEEMLFWGQRRDAKHGDEAICMLENFDDTIRGLALEYKAVYDKAVCEGVQALLDDGENLIFDMNDFNEPGANCTDDASLCTDNQVCTFIDQDEVAGKYCITPCNTADLLNQLRAEIRRVNQIASSVYWDPNALYADVKDERVRQSQMAVRNLIEPVREDVFHEVFDRIWSTVALHEVGHTMGLRHNFASSTDALNYFPDYWNIKGFTAGDGNWYPTSLWQRDTRDQVAQRLREHQQTSVMEYGSGFNSRYMGLGAYDHAAIAFVYGGLVNVFNDPPDLNDYVVDLEEPDDDQPTNYGLSKRREAPLAAVLRKKHHTNFPAVFGSVERMQDRRLVPWQELILTDQVTDEDSGLTDTQRVACGQFDDPFNAESCSQEGSFCQAFPDGFFCTDPSVMEVPFRFCSDEYNYSSPTCQTRDEGADMFEVVANSVDDYESYWPFRAYKRDNELFYPGRNYWNSVFGYMFQWRKHFEHWAYDYARYNAPTTSGVGWWEERYGQPWHVDINGGLGKTVAAKMIFEQMANVFGRPSDGYYAWNDAKERYEPAVSNGKNSYCNYIQVREDSGARPMYSSYDFRGYLYTPSRAGTFYDRMAALQLMTYPYMIFVNGADQNYDIRRFRLSFADVWPSRMQNILSSMITSDPAPLGWCIEHSFQDNNVDKEIGCGTAEPLRVKPRLWFGTDEELDAYYENCEPLTTEPEYNFPTTQYRLPALATIYGMANLSRTFDRSFVDRIRLWLEGEGTDITVPDAFERVTYTDPFSGKTYVAAYDPNEYELFDEDGTLAKTAPRDTIPPADFEPHGHLYWPAAWMVVRANDLLAEYEVNGVVQINNDEYLYSDLQQMVGRLEIIRGLYRRMEFGF